MLEVMHRATIRVTPTTGVAAAAQILVERGLNCLPVVEYESPDGAAPDGSAAATREVEQEEQVEPMEQAMLVGLLTRSDLLMALARALGAFEPGMQLSIPLPMGDLAPLISVLQIAGEMHIKVRSVLAAPLEGPVPLAAMVRLGTINPAPLLERLQAAQIQYSFTDQM